MASRKWEISNKIWNAINKSWLDRTANPAAFTLASRVFFSLLLCSKMIQRSGQIGQVRKGQEISTKKMA
jgi:hypothetical protein